MRSQSVDVDALRECCAYVAREWGEESRYRATVVGSYVGIAGIEVTATDGARFVVAADRWGNVAMADSHADGPRAGFGLACADVMAAQR